jgi:tetratricopeptide (TPR) repeat protein
MGAVAQSRGMLRLASAALVIAAVVVARDARADLATGKDKLSAGDYKAALAELSRVNGKDRPEARLLLARAQLLTGDLATAEATATALRADKDARIAADARIVVAEAQRTAGRTAEARKDLEALVKERPEHRGARRQLALTLLDQGEVAAANALFARTMAEFDAQKLNLDDPVELFYLAESARYTSQYEFANDSYREAVNLSPGYADAGVAWANLFLQKYASELAEQTLEEVFKVNPNHPDAHAAMAAVQVEKTYDLAAVRHHVNKALAVNPRNLRALMVRASVEIDQNQWEVARKTLDEVLAVNPQNVEARSMLATIAWLRDDTRAYQAEKARVFQINRAYAELYRIVSRSAVREHRYVEAIELEKEAVKLKPDFYEAMSGVGLGYLRLGQEKEGLEWLEKSWKGDAYNVRTYNTLELFEKTIPSQYTFVTTKSFKIRYHKDEAAMLGRYLEPVLERAFEDMVKRYGFRPKTPVVLELYANRDDYSIRTVGLPDLGALGVCFGQVITAISPSIGDLNWGMVLWHELSHVFAIQLSQSRVPRWFTEGLAEYETLIARPEWRRENDADVAGSMAQGTLPSVAELNWQFMQPDPQGVTVAYYLSAVTVEYLATTYGFPKIVEALKLFGKGKETPEVITAITGKSVAAFDAEFRTYLGARLAPYQGTFRLPTVGTDDPTALEAAADAAPRDAERRARVALAYYYAGDADNALAAARATLAIDARHAVGRYIAAEVALRSGDVAGAKDLYRGLVGDGHDSFDIRSRLAQIAQAEGKPDEMVRHLCAAKKLDPERSFPYQELAEHYQKTGKKELALAELEHYVFLEQMQIAPVKQLVTEYAALSRWDKVRTYGELAMYLAPGDGEILLALARAYRELGQHERAAFTYDSALGSQPPLRRPALAHLGRARALAALGQKAKAKAAVQQALKTEPENAEALELARTLK